MSEPAPDPERGSRPLTRLAARLAPWTGSIRFRLALVYSVLLFGLAAAVVGGAYLSLARSLDDEPVSRTFVEQRPVLTPGGLAIEERTLRAEFQSLEEVVNQRALDQLRDYSFAALGLLFAASMGVGWVVAGRVLAPIGRITAVARDIQATDLSRRIGLDGPRDELRDLAETFDAMLGRLDDAFGSQRRFVRDASHELRNPLAVMRTNLDVVLADPDASARDLRRTAEVVSRTTDRLSHLVDDLLAHAREGLPERERERVELGPVVEEIVAEFAVLAGTRRLRLEPSLGSTAAVMGDRTALRQALANLVDNAVRLAPAGSGVRLATGTEGAWAFLSVADEGPGIAAEDHEAVFRRFHRGPHEPAGPSGAPGPNRANGTGDAGVAGDDRDRAEPDDPGGQSGPDVPDGQSGPDESGRPGPDDRHSGLGLAIVRQIAERHGGRVALASELGAGSTFVVWLPALPPPPS